MKVYNAYDEVAKASMKRAAIQLQDENFVGPTRKRVKIDGAWQKRGHASLNGVVTAIVEDKVVDKQAFSKHCKGCKMWNNKKGSPAYERRLSLWVLTLELIWKWYLKFPFVPMFI